MNRRLRPILTVALLFAALWVVESKAVEPGFMPLLDRDHTTGWTQCGNTRMMVKDGVATSWSPSDKGKGVYWYSTRSFRDFVIRLEYFLDGPTSNSGVFVRFPALTNDPQVASDQGYEIQIYGGALKRHPTGEIWNFKPPASVPQRMNAWNEMEVTVVGQKYTVILNGQKINDFIGTRSEEGYVGLQDYPGDPVHVRNVRIKELSATPAAPLTTIQTDASQPRIQVIKDQGPNATEWALTPLDETIPADIRQNLTFLREDLLDEGKKAAKSSPEAYKLASDYCDKLLTALSQREIARVQAGYSAAQADANKATSNQALDARRNHQMSWPQFSREESQRAALRESETNKADVKKQRLKVEWATRAEQMRFHLDNAYRQLREAMR